MRGFGRAVVGAFAAAAVLGSASAWAQDPVKVAPDVFKVVLENPHVRVLDVTLKPGAKVAAHAIAEHVGYVLEGGKLKFTAADGTTKDMELKAGEVKSGPAEVHSAENVGTTPVHGVLIELRDPAPAAGTGSLGVPADKDPAKVCADSVKVIFENDRVRVTVTTLKAGGKMAMHGHPGNVTYGLTAAKVKVTDADGKSADREVAKGSATWSEPTTHTVENLGSGESKVLNFEIKQAGAAPASKKP